jgi:hypothetical protein
VVHAAPRFIDPPHPSRRETDDRNDEKCDQHLRDQEMKGPEQQDQVRENDIADRDLPKGAVAAAKLREPDEASEATSQPQRAAGEQEQ